MREFVEPLGAAARLRHRVARRGRGGGGRRPRLAASVLVKVDPRYFRPDRGRDAARRPDQGQGEARLGAGGDASTSWCARWSRPTSRSRGATRTWSSTASRSITTMNEGGADLRRRPPRAGRLGASCGGCSARGYTQPAAAHPRRARPARPGGGRARSSRPSGPTYVFLAAAKVGGILANDTYPGGLPPRQPADPDQRHRRGLAPRRARSCCFLGSSCIYPKLAPQPMREESLLTGPLEPTNEWYAIAKIAGIKLCQAYPPPVRLQRDLADADQPVRPGRQLRPAELARAAGADPPLPRGAASAATPEVVVWGTGTPRREFLHVDDLADALRVPDASTTRPTSRSTSAAART